MKKADYGKIASFYDRARPLSEQNLELWLRLIASYSNAAKGARVLDLGCGTGRFAIPMAERLGYSVTGADASEEMLAKGKEKDTAGLVKWDVQDAQRLTYPDRSFDLVFMSHLLHHVESPTALINECARVLDVPGAVFIRYGPIEQIQDDIEHTFFPEVLAIERARTPTARMVEKGLGDAGLADITSEEVPQKTYESGADRLRSIKLKSTSVLTMISEQAFERGVRAMEEYVRESPDDPRLVLDALTLTVGYKREA